MKHKIATSAQNSNQISVSLAESDAELKTTLQTIQADKTQRLWWFSSEPEQEQKKGGKS
jgi:hypothetical protein